MTPAHGLSLPCNVVRSAQYTLSKFPGEYNFRKLLRMGARPHMDCSRMLSNQALKCGRPSHVPNSCLSFFARTALPFISNPSRQSFCKCHFCAESKEHRYRKHKIVYIQLYGKSLKMAHVMIADIVQAQFQPASNAGGTRVIRTCLKTHFAFTPFTLHPFIPKC